jgi:hypothetical protein
MKSIVALSVLFVAQAVAKIGFGPCPIPSFMSFADYQAAYTATGTGAVYNHKLVFGDKGLEDLLGLAKTFVAQLPNFKCGDLFPQALYYADVSIWNTFYNQPSDSLVLGLLGFHLATKSEALYYCIDTARAPAILHMIVNAGIPIPAEVMQAYSMINQIQQSLNFLNIQFRFEGMFVTTDAYAAYNLAAPNAWLDGLIAKVPEYTRADFIEYKAGC